MLISQAFTRHRFASSGSKLLTLKRGKQREKRKTSIHKEMNSIDRKNARERENERT